MPGKLDDQRPFGAAPGLRSFDRVAGVSDPDDLGRGCPVFGVGELSGLQRGAILHPRRDAVAGRVCDPGFGGGYERWGWVQRAGRAGVGGGAEAFRHLGERVGGGGRRALRAAQEEGCQRRCTALERSREFFRRPATTFSEK